LIIHPGILFTTNIILTPTQASVIRRKLASEEAAMPKVLRSETGIDVQSYALFSKSRCRYHNTILCLSDATQHIDLKDYIFFV